jgi:hypothetical protein
LVETIIPVGVCAFFLISIFGLGKKNKMEYKTPFEVFAELTGKDYFLN